MRSTNTNNGLGNDDIRKTLNRLQTLVLDINDDLDSQLQAEDLLATNNFLPASQGKLWHFSDDLGSKSSKEDLKLPTPDQILKFQKPQLNTAELERFAPRPSSFPSRNVLHLVDLRL